VTIVRQVTIMVIEMRLIDVGSALDSIEMMGTVAISISVRSIDGWSKMMWSHPLDRVGLFHFNICGQIHEFHLLGDICGLLDQEAHLDLIFSRHQ